MKKIWKVLGLAALAGLVPYSFHKDEDTDTLSVYALLWKFTKTPHPEEPDRNLYSICPGYHNPSEMSLEEAEHYADELLYELKDELVLTEEEKLWKQFEDADGGLPF